MDDIIEKYPNDVKVVIKNFPLSSHKQAYKAALYVLAAERQGKFYELYKKVLENYRQLKNNEDLPLEYAAELGIDLALLKKDMEDPALKMRISAEVSQLRGTDMRKAVPKFLINGKEPKKRSVEGFSEIIDDILKKN